MQSISSRFYRNIGRAVVGTLILMNIINIIIGEFTLWISLVNIIMASIGFFFMMKKVSHLLIRERIAESILNMTRLVHNVSSKEELYQSVLEEVVNAVQGGEKGSLMRLEENGNLTFEAVVGFDLEAIRKIELRLEDTFLYRETNGNIKKSVVVENISEYNTTNLDFDTIDAMVKAGVEHVKTTISSPILINGKLFGMINVDSTKSGGGASSDVALVDYFSTEVSKIIHLYQVFNNTIESAKYDHLTNAMSRSNFMRILEHIMKNPKICPETFVLVYSDLDGLKTVNDRYGHEMGDTYLKQYVNCMSKHLTGEEIISRFGGDEFVILLLRDEAHTDDYIAEAKTWLSYNHIIKGDIDIEVKFSYGTVMYPKDGLVIKELIVMADERMYKEKRGKR